MKQLQRRYEKQIKKTTTLLTILLPMLLILIIQSTTPAMAQTSATGETVGATTDAKTYHYGDTIQLTIEDFNQGATKTFENMKSVYAGIPSPCGIDYMDFAFLPGDYTSISTYDDLVAIKDKELNVVYDKPYSIYFCPMGYLKSVQTAEVGGNSHDANMTFDTPNGPFHMQRHLKTIYQIQNTYGKESLREQVGANETLEYVESQKLPVGKYTIITFTLSGDISKPTLIEITNSTTTTASAAIAANPDVQATGFIPPSSGLFTLLTIPVAFGGILMAASYRKSHSLSSSFKIAAISAIVATATTPVFGQQQAFATYNVSSQGVEHRNIATTFKTATVENDFQGIIVDINANNGMSVQNNHFIRNFVIGTDFLWSQSGVQLERPNGVLTYSHSCTTQAGSWTCKFPSTVNLRGVYNFWTNQFIFTCPSGFIAMSGLCVNANSGTLTGISITSSTTRLDLNAYQTIQSDGKVYLDQKYRTCTGSFSCNTYSTLYHYTTPVAYANSSTGHYDTQSISGTTYYGLQGNEGECGSCNSNTGRANFYDGTYTTQSYVLTGGGTSASPAYRATTTNNWPYEENKNICWWDTISNSGGSNPTFTATARYTSGCLS